MSNYLLLSMPCNTSLGLYIGLAFGFAMLMRVLYGIANIFDPTKIEEPTLRDSPEVNGGELLKPPTRWYCITAPSAFLRNCFKGNCPVSVDEYGPHKRTPFAKNDTRRAQRWNHFHTALGFGPFVSFDAWTAYSLGVVQFLILPYVLHTGDAWTFIAAWLGAQIAVGWKRWNEAHPAMHWLFLLEEEEQEKVLERSRKDGRQEAKKFQIRFNHFLIATGIVLSLSYAMSNWFLRDPGMCDAPTRADKEFVIKEMPPGGFVLLAEMNGFAVLDSVVTDERRVAALLDSMAFRLVSFVNTERIGLVIAGGADKRPLGGLPKAEFGTNRELALARARWMKRTLLTRFGSTRLMRGTMLLDVAAAELGPGTTDTALYRDRCVRIYAVPSGVLRE